MTRLGKQLIRLVSLESNQNGNGEILDFLSRECIRHRLGVYTLNTWRMHSL